MITVKPKVSIVMASYNHELYVKEAILSVLNQTLQDFEIIITDDGSSDDTVKMIKEINDKKIILTIFLENQGACSALNNSIKQARGKYIAVMNSDDVWVHNKLEKQVNFLENNNEIDAVFSFAKFFNENLNEFVDNEKPYFSDIFKQHNRTSEKWLENFFFAGNCLCHPSILIKAECYDITGLYDNRFRQLPDFDMWVKFIKKFNLHIIEEELVKFRIIGGYRNASSPSLPNQIRGRNELHIIYKNFFNNISINLFKKIFKKHLINLNFKDEEFAIEQAFLYLKIEIHSIIGIEMLYELLGNIVTKNILKEKYNFDEKDFMELLAKRSSFTTQSSLISGQAIMDLLINKISSTGKLDLIKILIKKLVNYITKKIYKS